MASSHGKATATPAPRKKVRRDKPEREIEAEDCIFKVPECTET
jgi:hypothetical protein